MKNFLVVTNCAKDENIAISEKIKKYIIGKGGECTTYVVRKFSELSDSIPIPENMECVIVLGGDGTMIRSANAIRKRGLPIIGMNLGSMGFLCDIDRENLTVSLDQLMTDDYFIEERMTLAGRANISGKETMEFTALNDIVIFRSGNLRVVDFIIYVNGVYLNTYTADGVIVSTPTGSTGYSMSCGGPIVDPVASMLLLTPISAHTLGTRSVVFNAEDEIVVEVGRRHNDQFEKIQVCYDSECARNLEVGDQIIIHKGTIPTRFVKLKHTSFLDNMRKKMMD